MTRFPAAIASILGLLLATASYAQNSATPAGNQPTTSNESLAGFTPANPYFGNILTAQQQAPKTSSASEEITPKVELFVGYSYIRFNVKTLIDKENFDLHGGTASIAGNVNRWLGLVADFGGYEVSGLPHGTSAKAYTYLFGPKFSHRGARWTPFAQFLFGVARLTSDVSTPVPGFFSASTFHENAFATALGGGLDLKLTKHVAWRVVQGEYLLTKF